MSTLGRVLGSVSVVGGVIGAAALGGMTAQRRALRHYRELDQIPGWGPADGFRGQPADRSYSVAAPDGVALHVEEVGAADAPVTVVFSHGWTLQSGAWYFQRAALAGGAPVYDVPGGDRAVAAAGARLVFYDQRSHGRSSRAPAGHSTLAHLADDLAAVIATAAPSGPVVLVGHSMGGMAILTLAGRAPELVADRVRGVGLISTSAAESERGLRRLWQINGSNPVLPWALSAAARYPQLFERSRTASGDAVWLATRSLGFADPAVPAPLVDYLDEMISATPMEVIAEFAPALFSHDERAALARFAHLPAVIVVGDEDRMTPPSRAEMMAAALPSAELIVLPRTGHMAIMERPEPINAAIDRLIRAAARPAGAGPARSGTARSGTARAGVSRAGVSRTGR